MSETNEASAAATGQPKSGWKPLLVVTAIVVLVIVLLASFSSSSDDDGSDASARLACGHFRNVMADVARGVLTDAELRDKLQEIDEDASVSEVSDVRLYASAMLTASTMGDTDVLILATGDMDAACTAVGE